MPDSSGGTVCSSSPAGTRTMAGAPTGAGGGVDAGCLGVLTLVAASWSIALALRQRRAPSARSAKAAVRSLELNIGPFAGQKTFERGGLHDDAPAPKRSLGRGPRSRHRLIDLRRQLDDGALDGATHEPDRAHLHLRADCQMRSHLLRCRYDDGPRPPRNDDDHGGAGRDDLARAMQNGGDASVGRGLERRFLEVDLRLTELGLGCLHGGCVRREPVGDHLRMRLFELAVVRAEPGLTSLHRLIVHLDARAERLLLTHGLDDLKLAHQVLAAQTLERLHLLFD